MISMNGTHDHHLVVLSVAVAAFASFTALSLANRIRASKGRARKIWLMAAAVALGGGIWSMHFVAMLAFSMPGMSISYDLIPTFASLALAIGFTGAGLAAFNWHQVSPPRIAMSGALIAMGVVAMHYLGMAAMRMPAALSYDWRWVAISVIIAFAAATAAMWLASRDQQIGLRWLAAAVMGGAISGMHYSGMYAADFVMTSQVDEARGAASFGQTYLAIAISFITVFILLLSLGAAQLERMFRRAARREARIALRLTVADILRGDDPDAALQDVASLLGEHFGVARAGFGDLDPDEDQFDYRICWTDGVVPPLIGRYPAAAFGVKIVAALNAGKTIVIEDLLTSSLSDEALTHKTARDVDTRAILVVPFVREGRLRTIAYLNNCGPRRWRADEVAFMEEMAERIRMVIERVLIEDQLRELNVTLEARVETRTRELQLAESARREVDALYRAYFENTPDPLFVIGIDPDMNFVVEQVNPAHENGVGFKLEEIRGKRVQDFLPPEIATQVIQTYRHVMETGEVHRYREIFMLNGEPQHWDTTLVPLCGPAGQVTRIIGSSRNVSAQVAAEEALRQSQKMEAMGQLTGGVAHDFNNLLTPIMGALDHLNHKDLGDERERRLIASALQSTERARTLVQRLLSFARRQPLQPVPTDVAELARGMIDLIARTLGAQIQVSLETESDLPAALVDPNQLEMALLNLSVNARDAMPNGGTLRISVTRATVEPDAAGPLQSGDYVRLCIADTGTGMDEETRRRAVEPFFSTKGIGRGTGLGLSMAHGLAAQLGGALTIDSALGEGTHICLWVPTTTLPLPERANVQTTKATHGQGTVLLVDDDDAVRASAEEMLFDLGYTVVGASSAAQAWTLIDQGLAPDLLITDHIMPGMTGTELARAVRQRYPGLGVLVISGYAEETGIDPELPRLHKPFLRADLAEALKQIYN